MKRAADVKSTAVNYYATCPRKLRVHVVVCLKEDTGQTNQIRIAAAAAASELRVSAQT